MSRLSNSPDVIAEAQSFLAALGFGTQGSAVADAAAATAVATTQPAHISRVATTVDASAGGTAQTTAIATVPANSLVLGVLATVVTPFNGATTTTLEVGVTANPDQFIDTVDFDPSAAAGTDAGSIGGVTNDDKVAIFTDAAISVEALWTNTTGATAGDVLVTVLWVEFGNSDIGDQVDALVTDVASIRTQLNLLIGSLETGGIIST
jgi:hypothetical protein